VDRVRLSVLEAEVRSQLDEIAGVVSVLEERANQWAADDPASIESVAYQLHNLYNAIEDLMQIVAKAFENSVSDFSRWYTQLVDRMTLEIEGVRPALLQKDTALLLHELRAFRHFFRHAYGVPLDFDRVEQNLHKARRIHPLLVHDVNAFLEALGEAGPNNDG
jgi:hypothetical protein